MTNTSNPEIFVPSDFNSNATTAKNGVLVAFYPSNYISNGIAWKFVTPSALTGSVAVVPGAVLFGDGYGNLYALNWTDGNVLFNSTLKSSIAGGVSVGDGHLLVGTVFGSSNTGVYALSLNSSITNAVITPATTVSTTSTSVSTTTIPQYEENANWTSFVLDYNNSRRVNSTTNASNVGQLRSAWNITTHNSVTSMPLVQNGNLYFADWGGYVYSANILIGSINWKRNLGGAISSTPLLYKGVVYVALGPNGTADSGDPSINALTGPNATIVYALNQSTGSILWSKNLHKNTTMDAIWGSPVIYNGLIYIGVASSGAESNASWKGEMFALNPESNGTVVWNAMVGGNFGGAGIWSTPVFDPNLNSIYFGTGNPYAVPENAINLSEAISNTLYGYSIVSLNAATGIMKWHHQIYNATNHVNNTGPYYGLVTCNLHNGTISSSNGNVVCSNSTQTTSLSWNDSDFGASANLFSLTTTNSVNCSLGCNAIGVGAKDGNYYVLNRNNGALIEKIPIGTSQDSKYGDGGIIGSAGITNTINPEIFVPSYYSLNASNFCDTKLNTCGIITAFYSSNGFVAWSHATVGIPDGSVTVIPGVVLVGDLNFFTGKGQLYGLSISNGTALFNHTLSNGMASGITVADGYVLAGGYIGNNKTLGVYAFSQPSTLASVPLLVALTSTNVTSNVILDAGQNMTLTATSTARNASNNYTFYIYNGTSKTHVYSCHNTFRDNGIVTAGASATCTFYAGFDSTLNYTFVRYTNHTFGANVTTGSGTADSNLINARVYGDLNNSNGNVPLLTLNTIANDLSTGQNVIFTLKVNGGAGPFNVELYNSTGSKIQANVMVASAGGTDTISFVASKSGQFQFYGIATDLGTTTPFVFNSTQVTLNVNTLVAGPISASQTAITTGQPVTLTYNASGGTPPYPANDIHWFSSTSNTEQLAWNSFNPSYEGKLLDSMESISWTKFSSANFTVGIDTAPGNYVEGLGSIGLVLNHVNDVHTSGDNQLQRGPQPKQRDQLLFLGVGQECHHAQGGKHGVELDFINNTNYTQYFSCGFDGGSLRNGWNPLVISRSACISNEGTPLSKWSTIGRIVFKVYPSALGANSIFQVNLDNLRYNYQGGIPHKAVVMINFDDGYANVSNLAYNVIAADH